MRRKDGRVEQMLAMVECFLYCMQVYSTVVEPLKEWRNNFIFDFLCDAQNDLWLDHGLLRAFSTRLSSMPVWCMGGGNTLKPCYHHHHCGVSSFACMHDFTLVAAPWHCAKTWHSTQSSSTSWYFLHHVTFLIFSSFLKATSWWWGVRE